MKKKYDFYKIHFLKLFFILSKFSIIILKNLHFLQSWRTNPLSRSCDVFLRRPHDILMDTWHKMGTVDECRTDPYTEEVLISRITIKHSFLVHIDLVFHFHWKIMLPKRQEKFKLHDDVLSIYWFDFPPSPPASFSNFSMYFYSFFCEYSKKKCDMIDWKLFISKFQKCQCIQKKVVHQRILTMAARWEGWVRWLGKVSLWKFWKIKKKIFFWNFELIIAFLKIFKIRKKILIDNWFFYPKKFEFLIFLKFKNFEELRKFFLKFWIDYWFFKIFWIFLTFMKFSKSSKNLKIILSIIDWLLIFYGIFFCNLKILKNWKKNFFRNF